MIYRTLNPTTGELLEEFPLATDAEVERGLAQLSAAFDAWRHLRLEERARPLERAAELLEERAGRLARLMATEMGKPLAEGEAEARKCAVGCRYFAAQAPVLLAGRQLETDGSSTVVRHEPLGPVLAIMPWNYPFWQFFRFAAPALMAGNAALLKHAPNTPRCALAIEALLAEAGFPEGLVRSLFLSNEQAARVMADPRLRGVTLTGSTVAGAQVAAVAGGQLKPMVMELGGSDPFVVFADADVDRAVEVGVAARCQNSGQSCIASKRFIVHRSRFDEFAERFTHGMRSRSMGDPLQPQTDVGPLARLDLRDTLVRQVEDSLAAGATALCGGAVPAGPGFFYPPTVLIDVAAGSPAADEELFGPVATLIPFDHDEEAVTVANATRYGLGASIWSRDPDRARKLAARIDAGNVFVNGMVKSDPRWPFGGVKDSGFGRELSREGMLEFVNVKTVWIA